MKRRGAVTLGFLLSLVVVAWLGAANPFNFFVRRSERFSMKAFRSVRAGVRIEDVIANLGKPIKIVRSDQDLGCPGCVAYYFLGDPPPWLVSYQEAWLLVDHGRVVTVIINSEP